MRRPAGVLILGVLIWVAGMGTYAGVSGAESSQRSITIATHIHHESAYHVAETVAGFAVVAGGLLALGCLLFIAVRLIRRPARSQA